MMSNLITPHHLALEETELQIREGGRHPDPEIRGRGGGVDVVSKFFFPALRASVWSKNKGGRGGGGGGVPGSVTALVFNYAATVYSEIT